TAVVGNYHDDGIYVSTAKALAEDGTYRLVNLPGTPLQTKYPILYPFLLSLLWKAWPAFPQNTVLLQLFALSCAALALGIVCVHVVNIGYATRSQALLAYAICGSSPIFLYFSSQALSEPLFAALLAGSLWRLDRALRNPRRTDLEGVLTGVVLALPFFCRTIGIVIIPISVWLLRRHKAPVGSVVLGMSAVVVPWMTWV